MKIGQIKIIKQKVITNKQQPIGNDSLYYYIPDEVINNNFLNLLYTLYTAV